MPNDYFNASNAPATGSTLASATIRAEFQAIETMADKLPALSGNGDEAVVVNGGGTALTTVTKGNLVSSAVAVAASKATPVDADELALADSAASFSLKKLTWANLKAAIKTYYDSLTTTLTNKTISLTNNTLTGTTAEFNSSLTDGDFATLAGTETLTNKTLTSPTVNGGTINNAVIGGTTAAAGTFTTLTSTGNSALGDAEATDTHSIKGATTVLANTGAGTSALTITQTGAGNALVVEDETSPDSTPFVVNSDGSIVIGKTTTGTAKLTIYDPSVQIAVFQSDTNASARFDSFSSVGGQSSVILRKAQGTLAAPTAVGTGTYIGGVTWQAYGGTSNRTVAQIVSRVTSYVSDSDISAELLFLTSPAGSAAATERMRIASDGTTTLGGTSTAPAFKVIPVASQVNYIEAFGRATGNGPYLSATGSDSNVPMLFVSKAAGAHSFYTESGSALQVSITHTASANRHITLTGSNGGNPTISTSAGALALGNGQLQFPASQNASADANTLDDYEEGTWTPTITFGGGSTGITYSVRGASYTKIGNRVMFSGQVAFSNKGSSTGAMLLTGLPFTVGGANSHPCALRLSAVTSGVGDTALSGLSLVSTTTIRLEKMVTGTSTQLTDADMTSSSAISFSGIYEV